MKFSCAQPDLAHGLKLCSYVSRVTNFNPSMRNVHIRAEGHQIRLEAANDSSAISLLIRAEVGEEGEAAVDCGSLYSFVRGGSGTITVHDLPKTKRLSVKRMDGSFLRLAQENNPPALFPQDLPDRHIALRGKDLIPTLIATELAGSKDPAQSFNAIWLAIDGGYLRVVGVDGYRAGYIWTLIDDDEARGTFYLPVRSAQELQRTLTLDDSVLTYLVGKRLLFDMGDRKFIVNQFATKDAPHARIVEFASRPIKRYFKIDLSALSSAIRDCLSIFRGTRIKQRIRFTLDSGTSQLQIQTNKENEVGYMDLRLPVSSIYAPEQDLPEEPFDWQGENWPEIAGTVYRGWKENPEAELDDFVGDGITRKLAQDIRQSVLFEFLLDAQYAQEVLDALKLLQDKNPNFAVRDIKIGETDGGMISISQEGINGIFLIRTMVMQ